MPQGPRVHAAEVARNEACPGAASHSSLPPPLPVWCAAAASGTPKPPTPNPHPHPLQGVGLQDTTRAFNAVLRACARSGKWDTARLLFDGMVRANVPADTHTFNALLTACVKGSSLQVGGGGVGRALGCLLSWSEGNPRWGGAGAPLLCCPCCVLAEWARTLHAHPGCSLCLHISTAPPAHAPCKRRLRWTCMSGLCLAGMSAAPSLPTWRHTTS